MDNREAIIKALEAFDNELGRHASHTWKQIGRCVYCDDCKTRLYQGQIPKDHANIASNKPREPQATTEMRARWNKNA